MELVRPTPAPDRQIISDGRCRDAHPASLIHALGAAAFSLIALASPSVALANATVAYKVTPKFQGGALYALEVRVVLRADPTGRSVIDLPDRGMGKKDRWRFVSAISVRGASVAVDGAAKRVLISKPNATIEISYRVQSAYESPPTGDDGNPYKGAAILPTWFTALGDFMFVVPEGREKDRATFRWGRFPIGWIVASDLDRVEGFQAPTVSDVLNSTMLGGSDVHLYARPIPGGVLRIAIRGDWSFPERRFIDDNTTVIGAQRRFWGGGAGPYFISVIPLANSPSVISVGGTARFAGFALYGTGNAEAFRLQRILAHEHIHNWIPFQQGRMPEGADEPSAYWYSEGFTDFYADRTLLRSGAWTTDDFLQHLNEVLREYDTSPVRTVPNSRIVTDFWINQDVQKLAYERGYLLAFVWDNQMRRATRDGAGLDQVMFAMRDRYASAADGKPPVISNFEQSARDLTGVDVRTDVEKFAIHGDPITLPPDVLGVCAKVAPVTLPEFDVGFDADASAEKGVFIGVNRSGPAYRAGLRDGMKRIAREGGELGDSRVEFAYRVVDQTGAERMIRYKPEGATMVSFQQASLTPRGLANKSACAARLSGSP